MGIGRVFGFVGTMVTMAIGMYIYSLQVKTLNPGAGNGSGGEVTTITGVKNDLISIANAERGFMASQGKYASMGTNRRQLHYDQGRATAVCLRCGDQRRGLSSHCDAHHERRSGTTLDYRRDAGASVRLS